MCLTLFLLLLRDSAVSFCAKIHLYHFRARCYTIKKSKCEHFVNKQEVFVMTKILIVEDETRISSLLKRYLEKESFIVDVAEDGETGSKMALSNDYDLFVLDVLLPNKNGYIILEEIRAVKNTPVVMLSAQNERFDQKKRDGLGATDFIPKPFSFTETVQRIKELIEENQYKNRAIQ
jgi:DNA-binding response OmpR family regulator